MIQLPEERAETALELRTGRLVGTLAQRPEMYLEWRELGT